MIIFNALLRIKALPWFFKLGDFHYSRVVLWVFFREWNRMFLFNFLTNVWMFFIYNILCVCVYIYVCVCVCVCVCVLYILYYIYILCIYILYIHIGFKLRNSIWSGHNVKVLKGIRSCCFINIISIIRINILYLSASITTNANWLTYMNLADAFIQRDLHCIQGTHLSLISSCFSWESNPWPCGCWHHAVRFKLQVSY